MMARLHRSAHVLIFAAQSACFAGFIYGAALLWSVTP